jgi:type I restriction enzyme, S subunit
MSVAMWPTTRSRFVFQRRDIRGADAPLASATKDGVLLRGDLDISVWNPESDVSNYKLVEPGDFVIGLRSFQHGISHSEIRGIVSPAYTVLRGTSAVDPRFFKYYFRSVVLISRLANITQGIRQGQTIDIEAFANLELPVPPLDQQRRIADFLDAETARIDGLAAARRKMRDLLTSRRERTVEQIIGLDTRPSMIPLKYAVQAVSVGIVITPASWYVDEAGIPALRGLNVQPGHIDTSNLVQISQKGHRENIKSRLSAGDVIVVRTGQAGAAAVVPGELDGCNCIDLLIIHPGKRTDPFFLAHYLNSFYARDKITEHSVGSIQAHFNVASMKNLAFPEFELSEQQRRAEKLNEVVGELELLDSQLETQLELLGERRQALITAAVTGGITV